MLDCELAVFDLKDFLFHEILEGLGCAFALVVEEDRQGAGDGHDENASVGL